MSPRKFFKLAAHVQLLPVLESGEETLIGGQAVMEGVMMRSPHNYCVAVRKPNGEIVTEEHPIHRMSEKYPLFGYPILRGIGTLGQAMKLGIKALKFSADAALDEPDKKESEKPSGIPGWVMTLNLLFSVVFFIFMYKAVPLWITTQLANYYPSLTGQVAFNGVDGVIRLMIFLAFMFGISRFKDIHRVFEFHGAEHRVVFNFESGEPVSVARAQRFKTFHPRCGTSFLIVVMLISMVLYMVLPFQTGVGRMASRVVLIPLIAGLSYEVIRFAAKRQGSLLALMTAPGLWLQRITTQPPTDDQTEIAIVALERAMAMEEAQGGQAVIA